MIQVSALLHYLVVRGSKQDALYTDRMAHDLVYVTGFGKMCIVHTSDFEHLEMNKNYTKWWTGLKFSGMIKQ